MFHADLQQQLLVGAAGTRALRPDDEVARKLAMLIEGECQGLGPAAAARKFGLSKQRYFQLRQAFTDRGSPALLSQKRGPKRLYRRTDEVVRQVIRHRFLDPDASADVIAQKLRQAGGPISTRSVERVIAHFGLQKKLHRCGPTTEPPLATVSGREPTRLQPADPRSLERGVRQLLADKFSGAHLGLWLLLPEHLRLGTWDLLCGWSNQAPQRVEPRLALQLVHEAALCTAGLRAKRALPQQGFALANGLPFLAAAVTIHELLAGHTVAQAQDLQRALGQLRRASGHYAGKVLVVDPHRLRSQSKRKMRRRRKEATAPATKVAQTFFALDGDTGQPLGFTTGTPARTVSQATPERLELAAAILGPRPATTLVLADAEPFTTERIERVHRQTGFDLLVPLVVRKPLLERLRGLPAELFTRHGAGQATAQIPYQLTHGLVGPLPLFVQRFGETPADWRCNAFLCTAARDEVEALTRDYPKRWHVEEFFNKDQALGWDRAGTQNVNSRYGQMTLSLLAQAVLHQLRCRLGEPLASWDAKHLAKEVLQGLEGDVRVTADTIVVTYYNAPNADCLRRQYEGLPNKLRQENLNPCVPWLYNYQLDFRFR